MVSVKISKTSHVAFKPTKCFLHQQSESYFFFSIGAGKLMAIKMTHLFVSVFNICMMLLHNNKYVSQNIWHEIPKYFTSQHGKLFDTDVSILMCSTAAAFPTKPNGCTRYDSIAISMIDSRQPWTGCDVQVIIVPRVSKLPTNTGTLEQFCEWKSTCRLCTLWDLQVRTEEKAEHLALKKVKKTLVSVQIRERLHNPGGLTIRQGNNCDKQSLLYSQPFQ